MYGALRPALFALDPERAHKLAEAALAPLQSSRALQRRIAHAPDARLASRAMGIHLPSPLGVAAGLDKGATMHNALLALGFGHVEVGTVTPVGQPGNPRPRIQRHVPQEALVNRMGFPGPGAAVVARRLQRHAPAGVVGVNIGPNKHTAADDVHADIQAAARALAPHAAYLAINVSSPNTPGLRAQQAPRTLARLVVETLDAAADAGARRPVAVKLHPDEPDAQLARTARAAVDAGAAGVIATNTTRSRPAGLEGAMEGGLSGRPLHPRALQAVAAIRAAVGDAASVIGVGGVFGPEDVVAMVQAGADAVQVYTGFVYQGPAMARRMHESLVAAMDQAGVDRIGQLAGA